MLAVLVAIVLVFLALVPIALLIHHEVWRGPSRLDAQTLGGGPGLVLAYGLDCLKLGVIVTAVVLVALAFITALVLQALAPLFGEAPTNVAGIILAAGIVLAALGPAERLALRRPSRAIGPVLPWDEIWQMARGDILRLMASHFRSASACSLSCCRRRPPASPSRRCTGASWWTSSSPCPGA